MYEMGQDDPNDRSSSANRVVGAPIQPLAPGVAQNVNTGEMIV